MRGKALAAGFQARNRAFRNALREVVAIRDFVSAPDKILGSDRTKFGEIAEHVHVAIHRAKDLLHQRDPNRNFVNGGTFSQIDTSVHFAIRKWCIVEPTCTGRG